MIHLNIWLTAKDPQQVESLRTLMASAAELSRQEPGCLRFDVYQSQNDPKRFMLNEWWESQAALDQHRTAKAYTTIYKPQIMPHVDRDGHPCDLVSG